METIVDCCCGTFSLLIASVQLGCAYVGLDSSINRHKIMSKSNYACLTNLIQQNCSSAMISSFLLSQKNSVDAAKADFYRASSASPAKDKSVDSHDSSSDSTPNKPIARSARTDPSQDSQMLRSTPPSSGEKPPKKQRRHL